MGERRTKRLTSIAAILVSLVMAGSALALVAGAMAGGAAAATPAAPVPLVALSAGAITPSPAPVNLGQTLTLTANPSGGTAPYTYNWYAGSYSSCAGDILGGSVGSASTYTFAPTVNEYVCYVVVDSTTPTALTATSVTDLVSVSPTAFSVGTATPASPIIDSGQSVVLTANPSGGTSPYTYQWYSSAAACVPNTLGTTTITGATHATYTASPGATANFCYIASDSSVGTPAGTGTSAADAVTVNTALTVPTAPAITPTAPYGDSGYAILLTTAAPTGGTTPYSYQWMSGASATCSSDTAIATATASTYSAAPTATTYYCVAYSDSSTNPPTVYSPTIKYTVNATLTAGAITPAAPVVDTGSGEAASLVLTANPTGGALNLPSVGYTYQWYSGLFASCAADTNLLGTTVSISPAPASSTFFCYSVTDMDGTTALTAAADLVTVNPALVVGTATPAAPYIDSGQSVTLTANPSGGTAPYTYQWFNGVGCSNLIPGATASSLVVTAGGGYCYRVTDSSYGTLVQASATSTADTVTVNTALSVVVGPAATTIDTGSSVLLTATPSGGMVFYTYQWYSGSSSTCSSDTGIGGATGATYLASPTSTKQYCVGVKDGSTNSPTAYSTTAVVTVNVLPSAGAPTASGTAIDTGVAESITLTATPTGGTVPYTYQWYSGVSSSCASDVTSVGTTAAIVVSPASSTYYCYKVTDSLTASATSTTVLVTVNSALTAGTATTSAPAVDLGQTVTLTAAVSGGTPTYSYQWFTGSATCTGMSLIAGATTATYAASPLATTHYCYRVTDSSAGTLIQKSATTGTGVAVTVNPVVTAGLPSCIDVTQAGAACGTVTVAHTDTVTLTASEAGGSGTYTYKWYTGSSSVCGSDALIASATGVSYTATAPAAPGAYFCYTVTDSLGQSATSPTYALHTV